MDYLERYESILPTEASIESMFDRLWPICRSITGDGFRRSLQILKEVAPFEAIEVPSQTRVFDWQVPDEWNIEDAYVLDAAGNRVIDFKKNNLHVLNYSEPVDSEMDLSELQNHLYSLPDQPTAIPYVTSYYKRRWGFCLSENDRASLKPGKYRAVIKSSLEPGHLTYGHLHLPGKVADEFLVSTYLCHPSMANNELSGPIVTAFLYEALKNAKWRNLSYRFVCVPETIGSLCFLSQHEEAVVKNTRGGLVVTCVGDDREINYKRSFSGETTLDKVAEVALHAYAAVKGHQLNVHSFFPTGSDERQYCSPGFRLPVGSITRSMYARYPEYHTSLDNKDFISFQAMRESVALYLGVIESFEKNRTYKNLIAKGEPQLGPRGLYPKTLEEIEAQNYLLAFSDGQHDLATIAQRSGQSVLELADLSDALLDADIISEVSP